MITDIIQLPGDIIEHDPMYPEFDNECPKRHAPLFIKPRIVNCYEFNYILNDYVLIRTEPNKQYYIPTNFYDHYYSPTEINSMNDNIIKRYIKYYSNNYRLFEIKLYKKFLNMKNRNIMACIQSLIKEKNYRIMYHTHEYPGYIKRDITFDETWNTIFYYHLLPPRFKLCFLNIKEFKCSCKTRCNHANHLMLRLLIFRFLNNNMDLYYFIRDLI